MDRGRFENRVDKLRTCASHLGKLSALPERATTDDFRDASDLMRQAADDLTTLIKAELTGCVCRRIRDDNYDYLEYAQGCRHHRDLYTLKERLKADYTKMEKALKDEVRLKLVTAALAGAAISNDVIAFEGTERIAKRAIEVADDTIERLARDT